MGKLDDKVALITGSDSGIGYASAVEFAREGAEVIVDYLDDEQGADRTRSEVEALGRAAVVVQADHGYEDQVQAIDDPDFLEQQVQSIPLKRAARPEELAKLALFLASSDADYVTGAEYVMDGGLMRSVGQGA